MPAIIVNQRIVEDLVVALACYFYVDFYYVCRLLSSDSLNQMSKSPKTRVSLKLNGNALRESYY